MHAHFGLDLLDFFRGKYPWGKLLRLLGQLPSSSRYSVAQRADPEYIEALVNVGIDLAGNREMSEDEYGPVEARLDNITDAVLALRHALMQVAGGKPGQFKGVERPTNAIHKYIEKQRVRRYESLIDEVAQARERRRSQKAV